MLQTKSITKTIKNDPQTLADVEQLYNQAFPKQEQAPLPFLINETKRETIQFTAYYDGDDFVGLTYTLTYNDMTYLWYLAAATELRGKGYGSQILKQLREAYPNNRLILNLDVQDESANDSEIRKKRQAFYLKNGYELTNYECIFNKNHLNVMTTNGAITADEYLSIFKNNFGPIMKLFMKPKIIN